MSKEIYISSTPHETRLAIVEDDNLAEIYYERENEYTLAGSIYNGRVTRVLPGMQSSFVDIGLERDAFLYITDFMEEAGDSAEFDTANGESRRASRGEGDQDRRGRGRRERGGRDRQQESGDEHEAAPAEVHAEAGSAVEAEEMELSGEGAPGADSGRRWRGRRGRRRGRGGAGRNGLQQADAGVEQRETGEEQQSAEAFEDAHEAVQDDAFEMEASAAPIEGIAASEESVAGEGREERPDERGGRRDRFGRRERGGRDRDRGRERRAPRGFAPRTAHYGLDDSQETTAHDGPAPEPIVLPGESLSKYRKAGDEPAAAEAAPAARERVVPANIIVPSTPSFAIPEGWDGGAVLPGESLSRHRQREPKVEQIAPEAVTETEYEPVEASASYRVDPVAPSEYRQSAPVEDVSVAEPVVEAASAHEAAVAEPEMWQPRATEFEKFDWQTDAAAATVAEAEAAAPAHELTEIHASGEMTTEAPAATFVAEEAAVEAEPIAHETAVVAHEEHAPVAAARVEEVAADEDFAATLHASSIEEMDDLDEEETLEGAADLGTMLREMTIDEITRSDGDEEDDLEEADAANDPAFVGSVDEEELETGETETEEDGLEDEFDGDGAHADGAEEEREGALSHARDVERRSGRRDGRRGRHDRSRHSGDRGRDHRHDRRGGRSSVQATELPAITELLKPGQEVLVQIAKEPIAKKGARITSHIALPGRFLVFMPTVNHTGVSRKIDSDAERRRLKEILLSEKGDAAGGFIVRTAAEGASEEELRSDLRFLLNLWADIKQRSESSKSPALIYHDLNLVERILRDQVTDNFSAIWVDSESDYERILRFLQRFQPSLIRRVKLYTKETPLFEQFGISEEINKALRSKVWLKSGGSIVINQTEALVAIDINTGKYVGKTARLEDTIVKTNLDAIPEIVRQIRLRDLGGIIIIDFIDMDERKNRNRVMAALEEELKKDRAPSKVLQFNDFGLVAITRKRVKQSLERTLSTPCSVCQGTGMTKSPVTVCNDIYVEMRKMARHLDRGDVMLRVNPEVVKQLKAPGTKWLQEMEEMVGKTILVKSDPALHPEQFDIH